MIFSRFFKFDDEYFSIHFEGYKDTVARLYLNHGDFSLQFGDSKFDIYRGKSNIFLILEDALKFLVEKFD